ncbi:glycerophosphodiester phosphodiesterase family protein [Arthrobacter crystallopoietes]|uniref:glycerophosphodiester phosphodiesterase family protein n=1 Tax=Crystallibacter crystallopoietes TaxID=37928 RepID=UPI0011114F5D|nr:glycerophosphodiester phosphodiesterase family protein [Arthrobacter crystallopoietes]
MNFGQEQYAGVNRLLNERFGNYGTLIAVHRGTASGSIVENTAAAVTAALASGGDIIEIDVVGSTDGEFFAFHDGNELRLCGVDKDMRAMDNAGIRDLRYRWVDRPGRTASVEPLVELLSSFKGSTLFNLDRSWHWWPTLLPVLAQLNMADQLLLKCAAGNHQAISVLRASPVKFPFMPICRTLEEAQFHLRDEELNTVGVELIAPGPGSAFLDPEIHRVLNTAGVFTFVNAEVLSTGIALFANYDDEEAVLGSPATGWEPLFELGANVIQTDWPWLLRDYRWLREQHGRSGDQAAVALGEYVGR